jgi:hypothetical protein
MSDSLRDGIARQFRDAADNYQTATISPEDARQIADLLATEPATGVSDEAVELATIAWYEATPGVSWADAGKYERAAMLARTELILEAALPHLQPKLVASRERVAEVLWQHRQRAFPQALDWADLSPSSPSRRGMLDRADALLAAGIFRDETAIKAKAFDEGHKVGWVHHQDGNHGNDYWDDGGSNPYLKGGAE